MTSERLSERERSLEGHLASLILYVENNLDIDKGWQRDWCCAECRPDSDMLVEGFRCSYHAAKRVLLRSPATKREAP